MPHGQFKSVYALSSEDPNHPATNLLKIQSGKKWRTKSAGEKSAFVILQLDKSRRITAIDIGNEHSAFFMVAVGRMGWNTEDFKEILITSSLMTPIESKNSTTTNRVRCFANNALVESIAKEKWELVKVICTQPFNRHVQYGLSFITLHVAEDESDDPTPGCSKALVPEKYLQPKGERSIIAGLQLREDSPDSESETTNALFSRWKQGRNTTVSVAAEIRDASKLTALKERSTLLKPGKVEINHRSSREDNNLANGSKVLNRNRSDLFYDKEDDTPNERLERSILEDKQKLQKEKESTVEKAKRRKSPVPKPRNSHRQDSPKVEHKKPSAEQNDADRKDHISDRRKATENDPGPSKKRPSSSAPSPSIPAKKLKQDKPIQYRHFNKLLDGVVLVISGIQNPDRGILRQKALDLGARYKPDWIDGCTHLICAFKNTPKYNQVKGKGKIITRHWIEKCHSLKKRLPWRRFALNDKDAEKPESEDEIYDLSLKPATEPDTEEPELEIEKMDHKPVEPAKETSPRERKDSSDIEVIEYDKTDDRNYLISSGTDTDEDIERIAKAEKLKDEKMDVSDDVNLSADRSETNSNHKSRQSNELKPQKKLIVFEATTEEDENMKPNGIESEQAMPKLFDGLKFYIANNLSSTETLRVNQYIKQFRGNLVESMSEADFVISKELIEKASSFKGEIVNPLWVFECNDMECRIPTRRYLV